MADTPYAFLADHFDTQSGLVKRFTVCFWARDQSVEIVDNKLARIFLRRTAFPSLSLKDLFLGANIVVFARQYKLIDYANDFTRLQLEANQSRSIVIIRHDAVLQVGDILHILLASSKVSLSELALCQISPPVARALSESGVAASSLSNAPVVAMELVGSPSDLEAVTGAVQRQLNTTLICLPSQTRSDSSASLVCNFLMDGFPPNPSLTVCSMVQSFSDIISNSSLCSNMSGRAATTLLCVRPHILSGAAMDEYQRLRAANDPAVANINAPSAGAIISHVLCSAPTLAITGMRLVKLTSQEASNFLEVYQNVLPEHAAVTEHMSSGPCLAIELTSVDNNTPAVQTVREICGPSDPELARILRPSTVRAMFGSTKVRNAVHCTDLPEDGALETQYFFELLQR